jgi:hypothetical protein
MKELTIMAPEGFEFSGEQQPRVPSWPNERNAYWWDGPESSYPPTPIADGLHEVHFILKRTAPDMVAVMLPRDVAEWYADKTGDAHITSAMGAVAAAARVALARTTVLIVGPAGCAEVSVEQASDARCALTAYRTQHPQSIYADSGKAAEAAFDKAMGVK